MTRRRTRASCVAGVLLVAALVVGSTRTASAVDQSKGTPGFCPTAQGVTVVVDFQQLGGETIVRCFPTGSAGTGLDALKGAGFQIEGVQRWGEAFICRIENRPSAVESIPIRTDPHYQERCVDTPPQSAFWSYWSAGNNCPWKLSQWGVKNRDFVMGGFEGWSFSLNATANNNPKPRIAAVRPNTAGTPCATSDEHPPVSTNPGQHTTTTTRSTPATAGAQPTSPSGTVGTPRATVKPDSSVKGNAGGPIVASTSSTAPRGSAAGDPNADARFTGGQNAANVKDVLRDQSHTSPLAPVAAIAVVAALIGGTVFTAQRRRRARVS